MLTGRRKVALAPFTSSTVFLSLVVAAKWTRPSFSEIGLIFFICIIQSHTSLAHDPRCLSWIFSQNSKQFSICPISPQYCRSTPADSSPFLRKLVSSTAKIAARRRDPPPDNLSNRHTPSLPISFYLTSAASNMDSISYLFCHLKRHFFVPLDIAKLECSQSPSSDL